MTQAPPAPVNVFETALEAVVQRYKIDRFSDDARCLHYEALMAWDKQARADPSISRPDPLDIVTARLRCRASIGPMLSRKVYGKLFTVDREGVIHVSTPLPTMRRVPPFLIKNWKEIH